jgi:hypothetical protein
MPMVTVWRQMGSGVSLGSFVTVSDLIDSNQTRWVIPHRSEGVLVIQASGSNFIITSR